VATIKRARASREIRDLGHAQEIKRDLENLNPRLSARAGKGGRLFGSVTTADVVDAVRSAGGPALDRRRLEISGHIKTTGTHTVVAKLHPEVSASISLTVVASK
jgi:large subunit ribosomal protein L9